MLAYAPLKVFAGKNPKSEKLINTRKHELKHIHKQLKKISSDERDRVKVMWDLHKELFTKSSEMETYIVEAETIDDFFEK